MEKGASGMLKALICYLTGRHEYAVTCEPGSIFLQCRNCARRSSGWELREARERSRAAGHARRPALAPAPAGRARAS